MTDPAIPILGQYVHTNRQEGPVYQDSIEIGTPGRGGAIKVYFDASNFTDAEDRLNAALLLREKARKALEAMA